MAIIEYINVNKSYGNDWTLENFNLEIEQGEFVTIVGSSGSGKTTILKMVNGLIIPDSGTIIVEGQDIQNVDLINLRRNIGYAVQGSVLFPHMTVEENIAYVPNLLNKKNKQKTVNAISKWMGIVGLDDSLRDRYPGELSGGQQQRVGIARSLAASPYILLMDEPFGSVDEITRKQLQVELKAIYEKTGITVMFVTHDIAEALLLGTKVLVMNDGAIEQFDTPENILQNPATPYVEQLVPREK
ncbi:MAG: ABC transporter ATP-binding protein [Clostridiaceae bacterium]|nr:ABC transporter ATP-binding protein [Clostridiaceae bacterium]